MNRKEASTYLRSTLRTLVPSQVIDDVWDRVVAPLYDAQTVSGRADNSVRTQLDTSGHVVRCSECVSGYDPSCRCQGRIAQ